MPYVSGFLIEGPVDPGFGRPGGGLSPGHPDQGLPGSGGHPWVPGHLPDPPPNIWPPLTPSHPIQPAPPGTPPGAIWPPISRPVDPGYGHPGIGPEHPSGQPVPPPTGSAPPRPTPAPTPPVVGSGPVVPQVYWLVAGIPGVGWRYCAVDPSLIAGMPLPEGPPAHPDQGLPPTAQPRRG